MDLEDACRKSNADRERGDWIGGGGIFVWAVGWGGEYAPRR
jgi:hypothetical protein